MTTRRTPEFRHICAIARASLMAAPEMTDADWKGAVADTCASQGWEIPSTEQMARAFSAVERALIATTGFRRPIDAVSPTVAPVTPDKCWTSADYRALGQTLKAIAARQAAVRPLPTGPLRVVPEAMHISEAAALDQFYSEAATDRLAALKRFAEIALVRGPSWSFAEIRAEAERITVCRFGGCFGCRKEASRYQRHHIIQIQHGGSNYVRNIVAICDACHAAIHPWLPSVATQLGGWRSLSEIAPTALAAFFEEAQAEAKR